MPRPQRPTTSRSAGGTSSRKPSGGSSSGKSSSGKFGSSAKPSHFGGATSNSRSENRSGGRSESRSGSRSESRAGSRSEGRSESRTPSRSGDSSRTRTSSSSGASGYGAASSKRYGSSSSSPSRKSASFRREEGAKRYGISSERSDTTPKRSFDKSRSEDTKRSFGKKSFDDTKRPFGKSSEKRPYGERSGSSARSGTSERKPYSKTSSRSGERFGERSGERSSERTYSEKKPYSDKKFGDRKSGEKKFGDKKFSDKPYGEKKFGDKKFSDKPYGEKKFGEKKFASEPSREKRFTSEKPASKYGAKSASASAGKARKETVFQPLRQSSAIVRLNKFLADSGICSRRQADELVEQGLVRVNGKVVTEHGSRVHLSDLVTVRGEPVNAEKHLTYIVLNKPKDYITTTSDEKGRKTVMDLIPIHSRVYPIGRLDRHTTGVLLLTNDGDMAHRLMHPSYRVSRIYMAYLDKRLTAADGKRISTGVEITGEDDEIYVSGECNVLIEPNDPRSVLVELAEGKNREVRRIFETLGYEVEKLDRREYASITTRGLERGEYRHLTLAEIRALEKLVGLDTRYEKETTAPKPRIKERSKERSEPSSEKRGTGRSSAHSPKSARKDADGGKSAPKRKTSAKASTEGKEKTTKPRISKRPSVKNLLER
ncbi:MAG: rRNA pseudouridine synthase [Candidatus Kapabacteria bacterium]|jgi:23S rRNA pseudouridine2605 synthase|nr:rRNA pseudouridine synthase [Candidatus Kapabacteria bacterium]